MRIDHDLHVHTYLSACCAEKDTQRPAAILAQARTLGFKTIGFSDHLWMNKAIPASDWYRPQDERQVIRLREDLAALADTEGIRILVGCEADTVAPGQFSITRQFADTLDYVNLSCSHFHMRGFVQQPDDGTPAALGRHLMAFFVSAVRSGLATTIVHPLLPFGHTEQYDSAIASLSDTGLLEAFGLAAEQGVALEITPSFLPPTDGKDPGWSLDTPLRVLMLARQAGCRFCFGSDAHTLAGMAGLKKTQIFVDRLSLLEKDMAPIVRR